MRSTKNLFKAKLASAFEADSWMRTGNLFQSSQLIMRKALHFLKQWLEKG